MDAEFSPANVFECIVIDESAQLDRAPTVNVETCTQAGVSRAKSSAAQRTR